MNPTALSYIPSLLQAHPAAPAGLKPYHVPFEPYKSHQLARLLAQRVAGLPGPAFEPNALEMCARKVRWHVCG